MNPLHLRDDLFNTGLTSLSRVTLLLMCHRAVRVLQTSFKKLRVVCPVRESQKAVCNAREGRQEADRLGRRLPREVPTWRLFLVAAC